jgi:hypothetical protein
MSDKEKKENDVQVEDVRGDKIPIFIHSKVDELGLTLEELRVYCHLARRAGNKVNGGYPGYKSIGEKCFRANFPNAASDTLRRKAIDAVKELRLKGLISAINRPDPYKGNDTNLYTINPVNRWKSEAIKAKEEYERKRIKDAQAKERAKVLSFERAQALVKKGSVNDTTPDANNTASSANDTTSGASGANVVPMTPKGNSFEGTPIEGNPHGEREHARPDKHSIFMKGEHGSSSTGLNSDEHVKAKSNTVAVLTPASSSAEDAPQFQPPEPRESDDEKVNIDNGFLDASGAAIFDSDAQQPKSGSSKVIEKGDCDINNLTFEPEYIPGEQGSRITNPKSLAFAGPNAEDKRYLFNLLERLTRTPVNPSRRKVNMEHLNYLIDAVGESVQNCEKALRWEIDRFKRECKTLPVSWQRVAEDMAAWRANGGGIEYKSGRAVVDFSQL